MANREFDIVLGSFNRGLVTRVDPRDANADSLVNLIGFNLAQKYGQASLDYGVSKYFASLPAGLYKIIGLGVLRLSALAKEYVVIYGCKHDLLPRLWMADYYNLAQYPGATPAGHKSGWVELTEREAVAITSKPAGDQFGASALLSATDDYYNHFTVFNSTKNKWAFIKDYVGSTKVFTVDEDFTGWAVTDSVVLYRFPTTKILGLDASPLISLNQADRQHFFAHVTGDTLSIAHRRNVLIAEKPVSIERITRQHFYGGEAFLSPSIDMLSLGIEAPDYDTLEELGVQIRMKTLTATDLNPVVDLLQKGIWKDQADGTTNLYDKINNYPPGDAEYIYARLSYRESSTYEVGLGSVVLPAKGSISVTVRARCSAHNGLAMFLRLLTYINPGAANEEVVAVGDAEAYMKVSGSWQEYTIVRDIEDMGITGTVNIGLAISGNHYNPFGLTHDLFVSRVNGSVIQHAAPAKVRLAIVPQYNGYMLGRPIVREYVVETTAGGRYYPRVLIEYALMDKRLTDLFIFTDDGLPARALSEFMSAYEVKLTSQVPNKAGVPWNVVSRWENGTESAPGTGTMAYTSGVAIVGTDTRFTVELEIGMAIYVASQLRYIASITDDTHLTVNSAFAGSFTGQAFVWFWFNPYYATQLSVDDPTVPEGGSDRPAYIPTNRAEDDLIALSTFLGYGVGNEPVPTGADWRFRASTSLQQQSQNWVDESDTVLRGSTYSDKIHHDHTYARVVSDNNTMPLMLFLSTEGEILHMLSKADHLFVYKHKQIEVINLSSARSDVFEADVISRTGVLSTSIGLLHCGVNGVYVFPLDGGLPRNLIVPLVNEWLAISSAMKERAIVTEAREFELLIVELPLEWHEEENDNTQHIAYVYHWGLKIWWKRRFEYTPAAFARLYDGRVIYGTNKAAVAGSGTISNTGAAVVGVGTKFDTEAVVGGLIGVAGIIYREIKAIADPTHLTIDSTFGEDYVSQAYSLALPRIEKYPDMSVYTDDGAGIYWYLETQWMQLGTTLQKCLRTILLSMTDVSAVQCRIRVYFNRSATVYDTITFTTLGSAARISETPIPIKAPNSFKEVKFIIDRNPSYSQLVASVPFAITEMRMIGEVSTTGKEN